MKKNILRSIVLLIAVSLAGCNFLTQEPYDDFTNDDFWKTEDQARAFMQGLYTTVFAGYGTGVSHGPFLMGESSNDDFVSGRAQQELTPMVVEVADGNWSFSNIRRANYILENVDRLKEAGLSSSDVNHWRGVARFFRACYYSNLVFHFGDVPWFDRVPALSDNPEDMAYLYKDRDPRTFVDSCILADFQYAMTNVRQNDGALQINRYVVAGMASRFMLREGTFLKYHNIDLNMAELCLASAKDAALMVINSGKYSLSPSYKACFASDDLGGNPEMLMYRKYLDGILAHSTLSYSFNEAQSGASKALAESFLTSDGLPLYVKDPNYVARTAEAFFTDRDPRLSQCLRTNMDGQYCLKGMTNAPFQYALSGYSWSKFMDDSKAANPDPTMTGQKNVTDAPCLRYAEVLLNYVEAAYELNQLNSTYAFTQEDIDKSINVIRDRADVQLPHLEMQGELPAVNGQPYTDPVYERVESAADNGTNKISALLWEIRRERRVELCFEGFRNADLKRWHRLDYLWNGCNPDIRYGAYIVLGDYGAADKNECTMEDPNATEGYILRNNGEQRPRPTEKNYIRPVPSGQITLYEANGYHLSQNEVWK